MQRPRPGQEKHRQHHRADDHHRAQIGLEQNEARHESDDHQRGHQAGLELRKAILPASQIGGEVEHHRQLEELRRLNGEGAQAQPAPRALRHQPQRGDQDHDQEQRRAAEQPGRQFPPQGIVDARGQVQHCEAHHQPHDLPL